MTGTVGDRAAIKSRDPATGKCETSVALSPEWMVNCNTENGGCNGGGIVTALNFIKSTGVVNETCLP